MPALIDPAVPVVRSAIVLAPGERAEVLVDFSQASSGQTLQLLASTVSAGMGMGWGEGGAASTEVSALAIHVSLPRQPGAVLAPPARLAAAAAVVAGTAATVRSS